MERIRSQVSVFLGFAVSLGQLVQSLDAFKDRDYVRRDFCLAQGWEVYREYVDQSPANDLAHRVQWRQLLDDAARRRFTVVLCWTGLSGASNTFTTPWPHGRWSESVSRV